MATRKKIPTAEQPVKEMPSAEMENKEIPKVGKPENVVMIGGKPIEIKPTKLKYQRNRTAAFYHMLQLYPVVDITTMDAGIVGDDRDGDKALMDWLIAVTDDEDLITENYDEMDSELIEKMLSIFIRLNKIDEKEKQRKNLERNKEGAV